MKPILHYLLLLLLFFYIFSCKTTNIEPEIEIDEEIPPPLNVNCKEKSRLVYSENNQLVYESYNEFDPQGNIIKSIGTLDKNSSSPIKYERTYENIYDSKNNLIVSTSYFNKGFVQKDFYEYYSNNKLKKRESALSDGRIYYVNEFNEKGLMTRYYYAYYKNSYDEKLTTYNSKGKLLTEKTIQDGVFSSSEINEYDNNNLKIKTTNTFSDNSIQTILFKYNSNKKLIEANYNYGVQIKYIYDNGLLVSEQTFTPREGLVREYKYEYNTLKKVIKDIIYYYDFGINYVEHEYFYHTNGEIQKIIYAGLKPSMPNEFYTSGEISYDDKGNTIESISYNENGSVQERAKSSYFCK